MDDYFKPVQAITETCMNWCREQHFANDYSGMWILAVSFIAFIFTALMYLNSESIKKYEPSITDEHLTKYIEFMFLWGLLLLIGFFVKFLYLS